MGCGTSSDSARPLHPASDSVSGSPTPNTTADACAARVTVAATTPLGHRSDIPRLSAAFWGFVAAAEASGLEATLADLERFVDDVSIANLRSLGSTSIAAAAVAHMRVCEQEGAIVCAAPISLEWRVEASGTRGEVGTLLCPVHCSLLRTPASSSAILFSQSDAVCRQRFLECTSGIYLCGGRSLGRSKFYCLLGSPGLECAPTKADAVSLLGLQGYSKIQPGPLYLVEVSAALASELVRPRVALAYVERSDPSSGWSTVAHFCEGSLPGFTSGAAMEVVGETFELQAEGLEELAALGVRLHRCEEK